MTKLITGLLFAFLVISCSNPEQNKEERKTNIIYILADDLGYSEVGAYGQTKIETPNIDALSKSGMRFSQHYSGAPVCAPARSIFLTGLHAGHTPIRGNHEWGERGDVWNFTAAATDANLEGQYPMPDSTNTIAKMLRNNGYATGMVGKWGLGGPLSNSIPTKMGFDFFYGYNCQRQAHTYYPVHLWKNEERVKLNNKLVPPNSKLPEGADPTLEESYADFNLSELATDLMHTEALNFIDENKDRPFFLYYASPIPHAPLQAPKKWVDYYNEKFGEEDPYVGDRGYFPARYPRATYAAMVSYLDQQVGEIVQKLKDLGIYNNSIIIFTSDNGPTYTGGTDSEWFESAKPFSSEYGWGKGFVKEGGIRVPFIASWPGRIKPNSQSDHISSFYDMLPTFKELANIEDEQPTDGISMLPELLGKKQKDHDFLYWEFPAYGGQQAVRMGDWKAIVSNILSKDKEMTFELFNLKSDLNETTNVASDHPDVVAQIREILAREHVQSEIPRFRMPRIGDSE